MYNRVHTVKDIKETLRTDCAVSHYVLASFIFSSLCNTQEQSPLCKTTSVTIAIRTEAWLVKVLSAIQAFTNLALSLGTLFANVSTECCSHHQGESEEV